MRAVAKRIKAERERQGLSIADLAKILSVSEKDVLDLENGEMQLTMRDIDLFAIALEVSADRLKFGDDWKPNLGAQSKFENPRYNHSNVATNTAATMTTNNYYQGNGNSDLQLQINRMEQAAHTGRLGAFTQLDRIEEQNKLLLERIEHINEKIDFLMTVGEVTPKDTK